MSPEYWFSTHISSYAHRRTGHGFLVVFGRTGAENMIFSIFSPKNYFFKNLFWGIERAPQALSNGGGFVKKYWIAAEKSWFSWFWRRCCRRLGWKSWPTLKNEDFRHVWQAVAAWILGSWGWKTHQMNAESKLFPFLAKSLINIAHSRCYGSLSVWSKMGRKQGKFPLPYVVFTVFLHQIGYKYGRNVSKVLWLVMQHEKYDLGRRGNNQKHFRPDL